jgi:thiamine pyrophosphate-dependent acetolactate synthase large subunit-like protein
LAEEQVITVTSLSANAGIWNTLRSQGANFIGCNMGLCIPMALGLSMARPERKVIALDSDGSFMLDPSSLFTVADVDPTNLLIIVFDNEHYRGMASTATARGADLERVAQGAGIKITGTVRSLEEFAKIVEPALQEPGLRFYVLKIEPDRTGGRGEPYAHGRAMKEQFIDRLG